jgi:Type IV secretion system pilin
MLLLQLAQHTTTVVASVNIHHVVHIAQSFAADPPQPSKGSGQSFTDIYNFADSVKNLITALGLTVFFIGIVIAGMLRIMSFGSERRIAVSNMALTAAIIGLVIILGADGVYAVISTAFTKQ